MTVSSQVAGGRLARASTRGMQPFTGDQITHEKHFQRARAARPGSDFLQVEMRSEMITSRVSNYPWRSGRHQSLTQAAVIVADVDGSVHALQVAAFDPAIQAILPSGPGLAACSQQVDECYERRATCTVQVVVDPEKRWMNEFILDDHIPISALELLQERGGQIIEQATGITAPRQRDDRDRITLRSQVSHDLPIIEETAALEFEMPIDQPTDMHVAE
jgi:hypothetical protein